MFELRRNNIAIKIMHIPERKNADLSHSKRMNYEEESIEIYMRGRRMKTIEKIKIMLEVPSSTSIVA